MKHILPALILCPANTNFVGDLPEKIIRAGRISTIKTAIDLIIINKQ
jgi:hypothetical protein